MTRRGPELLTVKRVRIRVLLADGQALVRGAFRALLAATPDIDVVGEAGDGHAAVAMARVLRPDVVLMDVRLPALDGLAVTREIVGDPDLAATRVVILTTLGLDRYVVDAMHAGAIGFLMQDMAPGELVAGVRGAARGEAPLSPGATRRLMAEYATRTRRALPSTTLDPLTDREREVVQLVASGLSNVEISLRLAITPATARTHVGRAMAKVGARDRAQLVVLAYESGLVRPGWTG
jgi:DNA-binding NarL/FixJ family response regulator